VGSLSLIAIGKRGEKFVARQKTAPINWGKEGKGAKKNPIEEKRTDGVEIEALA